MSSIVLARKYFAMPELEVCFSPDLLHLHDVKNSVVVVTDILRASSCMVTAFANKVDHIVPVATLEECLLLRQQGYHIAAERDGKQVEGFDYGNSPLEYKAAEIKGKKLGITTSNGTRAITRSAHAKAVYIGAFLNLQKVVEKVKEADERLLLVCSGWKGRFSLEDTLFCGALIKCIKDGYNINDDAANVSLNLYQQVEKNLKNAIENSAHAHRLNRISMIRDIEFCSRINEYDVLPYLVEGKLIT